MNATRTPEDQQARIGRHSAEQTIERRFVAAPLGRVVVGASVESSSFTDRQPSGESRTPEIEAQILANYAQFEPTIAAFDASHQSEPQLPLGEGNQSIVHILVVGDKKYAMRTPLKGASDPAGALESHLAAAVMVRQLPEASQSHLERLVAASRETKRTIAEVMPGREVHGLTPDEVRAIPDVDLERLVDTVMDCRDKLHIDPQPRNILYDPEKGFGILDLTPSEGPYKTRGDNPSVGTMLGELGDATFMSIGRFGKDDIIDMTKEDYAHGVVVDSANVDLLERYATIVAAKLDGQDLADAEALIRPAIEGARARIAQYSDPEWVAAQIQERATAADHRRRVATGEVRLDLPDDILD